MKNKYLSNVEVEAMLGLWLVGALMLIRGFTLYVTPQEAIMRSDMYSMMNDIAPFVVWGITFIVGGIIILLSSISQTIKKYYWLLVGNIFGLVVGIPFVFISYLESHMNVTQYTVTLMAFFNVVLAVHAGVSIWKERKRIHSLQE